MSSLFGGGSTPSPPPAPEPPKTTSPEELEKQRRLERAELKKRKRHTILAGDKEPEALGLKTLLGE